MGQSPHFVLSLNPLKYLFSHLMYIVMGWEEKHYVVLLCFALFLLTGSYFVECSPGLEFMVTFLT